MLDLVSKEEGISRSILIASAEGCIQSEDENRAKDQSIRALVAGASGAFWRCRRPTPAPHIFFDCDSRG